MLFTASISANVAGNTVEQANSTIFTDTANAITPANASNKFFSVVNFFILEKIFFLFLSYMIGQLLFLT